MGSSSGDQSRIQSWQSSDQLSAGRMAAAGSGLPLCCLSEKHTHQLLPAKMVEPRVQQPILIQPPPQVPTHCTFSLTIQVRYRA